MDLFRLLSPLNARMKIRTGCRPGLRKGKGRKRQDCMPDDSSQCEAPFRSTQNLYPAASPITSLNSVGELTNDDAMRRYSSEKSRYALGL